MSVRLFTFLLALLSLLPGRAIAEIYPARPIRLIVPQEAGGSVDTVSRYIAARLATELRTSVVVENRSGASGTIGTEQVARAAPDGYMLLVASTNTHAMAPHVVPSIAYDSLRDFVPVVLISYSTSMMVVAKSVPVRSLSELAAYSRAHPGTINYGSAGVGSSNHLMVELYKSLSGADIVHIPYRGSAQNVTALAAGEVGFIVNSVSSMLPVVQAGKATALAVTGDRRLDALPDVPTVTEAGYPALNVKLWSGLMAPVGTPPEVIETINRQVNAILREPESAQWFAARRHFVLGGTSAEFAATLRADYARWADLVRDARIRSE